MALIALATTLAFAQGPAPVQEQIASRRVDVPAINQRINIAPIEEGPGAFSKPRTSSVSRISGIVINDLGWIVPSAGYVIVRSLQDGRVIGQTPVDPLGQFTLQGVEPGTYTAELVNQAGAVVTSTPLFSVGTGEIVQLTTVIPQTSFGGFASLIGSGTAGALHAAVNAGVLAVQTTEPISP